MFQNDQTMSNFRFILLALLIFFIISNPSFAADASAIDPDNILKKVIEVLNGTLARSLAIIALIIMGIGCWYGFFDFRKVGFFMVGIILVFGANWIMSKLGIAAN